MAKQMTEEARAAYNAYQRKWRNNHPEAVREYRRRHMATYWEKKAREAAEATAAALTEDQSGDSSGSDPEGQAATNGGELTDDHLREIVARKREQLKGVDL